MFGWFQAIMPKELKFFPLFDAHAAILAEGAAALRDVLKGGDGAADACARVFKHEDDADQVTREVLQGVRRSFITPFDRGDIQNLITSLDDAIDQMQKTAKVVMLFEVRTFDPAMQAMGDMIVEAAQFTKDAVALLPRMRQNVQALHAVTEKIVQLEDRSDEIYDQGRKALYLAATQTKDSMAFIIGVDILGHLERVLDCFEDVANRISGVVVEQV